MKVPLVIGVGAVCLGGIWSPARAAMGRQCKITVVSGETTLYRTATRTWDRTAPGTPDPKVRLQVGGYVFWTKMACNTTRPVWNQTFDACLTGAEDGTLKVVDVDSVTEDVMGATAVKGLDAWFGRKVFRIGGKNKALLRFGAVNSYKMVIDCQRRRSCTPPKRARETIQAAFVWRLQPPRFLLYRVLVSADKLKQYRKDAMQIELTHYAGDGRNFEKLTGVWGLPGQGQWNAFPMPLLCLRKGGTRKRTAKVVMEIKGSPTFYRPAFGIQQVICR